MKSVLVTGGAGYIASHCCKLLHQMGWQPVVIDNLSRGHKPLVKWGPLIEADLHQTDRIREVIEQYKIQSVMHFAALAYVGESVQQPLRYYQNNVAGTLSLLDAMRQNKVRKLVFSSTCSSYGNPQYIPIDENHPQRPINPYGQSKLTVEKILKDMSNIGEIDYVSLRYFNAAGCDPDGETGEWHEPETHLIPLILKAIMTGEPFTIFGSDYDTKDGTCVRDYIHVMDIAEAHIKALSKLENSQFSSCYNLGTEQGHSILEVIKSCERVTGCKVPYVMGGRREGDPDQLVASSAKIGAELDWKASYQSLDCIVESAWKWIKNKDNLI